MKLRCVSEYRNDARMLCFHRGQTIEVEEELGRFLLRDAPGCFEEITRRKSMRKPPRDKMIREPVEEK